MITVAQIRAGRAMARLTQAQLAARAGISTTAMNNIEYGTDAKGSTSKQRSKNPESNSTQKVEVSGGNWQAQSSGQIMDDVRLHHDPQSGFAFNDRSPTLRSVVFRCNPEVGKLGIDAACL
jgi:DNA-binding XRE family transcriptional regulator